jgi:hypothetical protein
MALMINTALTTRSGFAVPSGAYCWLQEERAKDNTYSVKVDLVFFKDKASFDAAKQRFTPQEIPDNKLSFKQSFSAADYAALTSMTIHNFVRAELHALLGANTVTIVQ